MTRLVQKMLGAIRGEGLNGEQVYCCLSLMHDLSWELGGEPLGRSEWQRDWDRSDLRPVVRFGLEQLVLDYWICFPLIWPTISFPAMIFAKRNGLSYAGHGCKSNSLSFCVCADLHVRVIFDFLAFADFLLPFAPRPSHTFSSPYLTNFKMGSTSIVPLNCSCRHTTTNVFGAAQGTHVFLLCRHTTTNDAFLQSKVRMFFFYVDILRPMTFSCGPKVRMFFFYVDILRPMTFSCSPKTHVFLLCRHTTTNEVPL
jgi:hypothetical protein